MKIMKNDEAVSPVIGVILMVAITVILAAVIAAFVFGLAGTTSTTKNVGLTGVANSTGIITTITGGTDVDKVTNLSYVIDAGSPVELFTGKPYVGMVNYTPVTNGPGGHRFIVTAKFQDGSTQVIFDKQF